MNISRSYVSRIFYTALVLYIFGPITSGIIQLFVYGISIVNMAMVLVSIFLYIFSYMDVNETVLKAHETEMNRLNEDTKSIKRLFDQTSSAFVAAMEKKDAFPQGHSARAAEVAGRIAKALGKEQDEIDEIYFAALLHNVGVMGIPDGILENYNKLSPEQYEVYKYDYVAWPDDLRIIPKMEYCGYTLVGHAGCYNIYSQIAE